MATAFVTEDPIVLASFRRTGEADDCYRVWREGPVIRVHTQGHWDVPTARTYISDITRIINGARSTQRLIRAIVDRRDVPTFAPGVPDLLLTAYRHLLAEGDRVAIIVDSSMTKSHIRRVGGRDGTETFLSVSAAQTWVLAYG